MLIQWGTDLADGAGIPCYVEASPAGYGLYQKMGFEEVDTLDTDMSRWGGEGVYHNVCMFRPTKVR